MQSGNRGLKLFVAAKEHYERTKHEKGTFKCPHGDHTAIYVRASNNGHFWIACKECNLRMNE